MKKFISLLLATSMAFAVPTFADTEGQSYAEVYAEKAKELFGITDPNYTYNFEKNDDGYTYFLNWNDYLVAFDSRGNVISFSNWKNEPNKNNSNPTTEKQIIEIAKENLNKILGENSNKMKLEKCEFSFGTWDVDFCQYIGDYKAIYNDAHMNFDETGTLLTYNCKDKFDVDIEESDNILDYETAKKKYIENAGFGKVFTTSYDFDTRDNYLFPCFTTTSYTTSYISATNGGKIDTYDDVYYSNKASDVYVETAGALSDAEEKTITNIKNCISPKEVVEIIKNNFGYEFSLNNLSTRYFSKNGKYYTSIYDKVNITNCATVSSKGQVVMFQNYNKEIDKNSIISNKELDKIALQYVNSLGYNDYKIFDISYNEDYSYYILYKYVDGVLNYSDFLTIVVNPDGSVNKFYFSDSTLEVPKFESDLSVENAFDKCADIFGFTLKYVLNKNDKAVLAYSFDDNPFLSPEGNPITSNNEEYVPKIFNGYTDIDDCPQKEYIEKLADLGLRFNSSEFSPNSTLTFNDIKTLESNSNIVDFYEINYFKNIYTDDHKMTKYDVSKLFCSILGLSSLCQNSNNYKTSYSDVYGENLPYVALCESLGIFNSGTEFNGNSTITRGEFAQILYSFIKANAQFTNQSYISILK